MDIRGKRFLVFGGTGFVGSHTVDALLAEEVGEVAVYTHSQEAVPANLAEAARDSRLKIRRGTLADGDALRQALAGVDGVFLLSSLWQAECVDNPRAALDVNVVGAFNVLEACRDAGVARVVYASSSVVYGEAVVIPMTEDHPLNNRSLYGATKIAVEQFLRAFYKMHQLGYVALRYTNVYGPRQTWKGKTASVVIRLLDRIAEGQPPVIFGDGSQSYDFVYVKDVARANMLAMQAEVSDEAINVGSGAATSINDLVTLLLALTGSTLKPEYRPQQTSEVYLRVAGTEKAERLLGFRAQTPLVEGLRELVQWRERSRNESERPSTDPAPKGEVRFCRG